MKRIGIAICLSILLLTAGISNAVTVKGISTLNDIGTPTTVTDAIITYDSSVPTGTGDQMTHIKFDGVATNCLNGTGMWIACAAGDVTSSAVITDNVIVRGDGGAKGVQESVITIADTTGDLANTAGDFIIADDLQVNGVSGNHQINSTLDEATGNEESLMLFGEVNKATSGDTRMIYASPKYTSAPGTDYLMDLGTNSATDGALGTHTSKFSFDNDRHLTGPTNFQINSTTSLRLNASSGYGTTFYEGNSIILDIHKTSNTAVIDCNWAIDCIIGYELVAPLDTDAEILTFNGQGAYASAVTNLDGGDVNLLAGDGASASAGDADGGTVNIQGGKGYGTGVAGNVAVISDLDTATNDEEVFVIKGEVDKATSGDTRMIYASPKYTTAPGTDYLMDLGTNSATDGALGTHSSKFWIENDGTTTFYANGDADRDKLIVANHVNTHDPWVYSPDQQLFMGISPAPNVNQSNTDVILQFYEGQGIFMYESNSNYIRFNTDDDGTEMGIGLVGYTEDFYIENTGRNIDEPKQDLYLRGADQKSTSTVNLDGGHIYMQAGDGASGSAGDADGGNVNIQGGKGYGTGVAGNVAVISDLDTATNDEEVFVIKGEVDKATSGDTRMIYASPKYTTAPGTDYLMDLGTNSATDGALGTHTSKFSVDNTGHVTVAANAYYKGYNARINSTGTASITFQAAAGAGHIATLNLASGSTSFFELNPTNSSGYVFGHSAVRPNDTATVPTTFNGQGAFATAVTNLDGGDVNLLAGDGASASAGDADGGNVTIAGGTGYGTGDTGDVIITGNDFAVDAAGYVQHQGCFGELYETGGSTQLTVTTSGTYYQWVSSTVGLESGNGYVDCDATTDDCIIESVTCAGTYKVNISMSFTSKTNADVAECAISVNDTEDLKIKFKRKLATALDVGSANASGLISLSNGDAVTVECTVDDNTSYIVPVDVNMSMHKIDS